MRVPFAKHVACSSCHARCVVLLPCPYRSCNLHVSLLYNARGLGKGAFVHVGHGALPHGPGIPIVRKVDDLPRSASAFALALWLALELALVLAIGLAVGLAFVLVFGLGLEPFLSIDLGIELGLTVFVT